MLGAPSVPLNERDLALHVKQRDELAHMASNVLDAMMLNSSSSGGSSSSSSSSSSDSSSSSSSSSDDDEGLAEEFVLKVMALNAERRHRPTRAEIRQALAVACVEDDPVGYVTNLLPTVCLERYRFYAPDLCRLFLALRFPDKFRTSDGCVHGHAYYAASLQHGGALV